MMKFTTCKNSRSEKIINDIIKTEDLEVKVRYFVNGLGDSMIEVKGEREDIETLRRIYLMVK